MPYPVYSCSVGCPAKATRLADYEDIFVWKLTFAGVAQRYAELPKLSFPQRYRILFPRNPLLDQSLTVQHQRMRPSRTQKCERQPFFSHTDGVSVGTPFASTFTSQRGLPSATTKSSIAYPQPQGQRIPTHQSSPSSRARTKSRLGNRTGKLSPSMTYRRRHGLK